MAWENWNILYPYNHTKMSEWPAYTRDVASSVKIILSKEHEAPGTAQAGGQHLMGSSRVYLDSVAPVVDPEGSSLETAASTGDNGRIAILTGQSNTLKVYVGTSAGISTGWQSVRAERVKLAETMDANGNLIANAFVATATQSGQPIHVGQLDTAQFQGQSTGLIQIKSPLVTGIATYLQASGSDGIIVAYSRNADKVDGQHVSVYDSGWFAGAATTTYTKAHGLGAIPTIIQLWYSDQNDGSGDIVLVGSASYTGLNVATVIDVDATNILVRVQTYLTQYYDSGGVARNPTTGYLKIRAVLIA
jgi:hypothetical protein